MKLREARFKKNMTQADIFKATGIQISKISIIERGYIMPTEIEIKKIASALSLKKGDIIYG